MIYIIKCDAIGYSVYLEYKASSKDEALEIHTKLFGDVKDVVGVFVEVDLNKEVNHGKSS